MSKRQFPCGGCGASLEFEPGAQALHCPYCGVETPLPRSEEDVEELDYRSWLEKAEEEEPSQEHRVVKCPACGAECTFRPEVTADECPFCSTPIVTAHSTRKAIKPRSLLPFEVPRREAFGRFRKWLRGLWFAPSKLSRQARGESSMRGVYVPYWTYDSDTTSSYRGQRGDDYWTTEAYTTTENGRSVTRTRQVRRTRWRSVSGTVGERFDDVLVLASSSLPRQYTERLEPWDLENVVPYADEYLSGFQAESYRIGLADGFDRAKELMEPAIRASVRSDIGGDHQRIHSLRTRYDAVTFKHLLLPVWISAYRWRDRVFRFVVNARTGEVQGERPWSWVKIVLAVLAALAAVGAVAAAIATAR